MSLAGIVLKPLTRSETVSPIKSCALLREDKEEMKNLIGKIYYWWWHDFMCRKEPYTRQARRHVKSWWLLWVIGAGLGGSGIVWFLLHLGGFC